MTIGNLIRTSISPVAPYIPCRQCEWIAEQAILDRYGSDWTKLPHGELTEKVLSTPFHTPDGTRYLHGVVLVVP